MSGDRTADGPVRRAVLDGLMTDDEHEAVVLAGRVACLLDRIAGHGDARGGDLAELCAAIHVVQNAVLAQAAARAFPDRYRLMGESPVVTGATIRTAAGTDRVALGPDGLPDGLRATAPRAGIPYERMPAVVELDPEDDMRLPRYPLAAAPGLATASFRWRDVLTVPAAPSDHGVLPYRACPVDGPHEPHRWAISGAETPDEVPAHAWWLCDPKPGLTGDSSRDLDELAAWSRRHPEGEERTERVAPPGYQVRLERCPRCGSDTCPGRISQLDCTAELDGMTASDEASLLLREKHTQMPPAPFTRADVDRAADEVLRANPYLR